MFLKYKKPKYFQFKKSRVLAEKKQKQPKKVIEGVFATVRHKKGFSRFCRRELYHNMRFNMEQPLTYQLKYRYSKTQQQQQQQQQQPD